jgi:hypothetical protein
MKEKEKECMLFFDKTWLKVEQIWNKHVDKNNLKKLKTKRQKRPIARTSKQNDRNKENKTIYEVKGIEIKCSLSCTSSRGFDSSRLAIRSSW